MEPPSSVETATGNVVHPPAAPGRSSRRLSVPLAIGALLGVLALAGLSYGWAKWHAYRPFAQTVFADAPAAYNFHLTDQNGQSLSLDQLRGKVVVLTFGFASCPNICPVTLANLSWAYNLLTPEEKAKVQVVFVSVDPARDTPEHLRGYVPFYNPAFLGVTGTPDELARTAKAYGVFFAADAPTDATKPDNYNVTHSAYVYLIDKAGRWRAMYNHDQLPERDKLAADFAHYAKE